MWAAAGVLAIACLVAYAVVRTERAVPATVVSLTFDDGFASQWTARRILDAHGYRGTFYINSARLGTPQRLNTAQVRLLADAGHEIGGHTLDHPKLPALGRTRRLREICDDRIALTRLIGAPVTSFAYPFGASAPAVEQDVAACGYNSARTVGGLDTSGDRCVNCPAAESMPPGNRLRFRSSTSYVESTPISQAMKQIVAAERSGGGWIPLVFHEVCDGCSKLAITPSNLTALLDWMRGRGVTVRTVGQVIGGDAHPAVASSAVGIAQASIETRSWRLNLRESLFAALALLFGLPIGGLLIARATGRW